ncbi:uncharacterized protein [Montipora foliosa]|uniref:uncharacterized protein n=1 Tax=Montipora foliosa TaxID=591990 RepID=UPI0035F16E5B
MRVVFDCAARFRETSLNDQSLQGPDLTSNLTGVLLGFQQGPVALVADVEQMFYQVRVKPEDCDALRFLWWEDSDFTKGVVDHQIFHGPRSSQTRFLAVEASRLGVFHLTKWISNCREVLKSIPAHERAPSISDLDLEDLPLGRALGTQWDVERDTLSFKVAKRDVPNTRRGMLSLISGLYDPLGFAAPFILPAKTLMQELSRQDLKRNEKIPDEKVLRWRNWVGNLSNLEQITWPRCSKAKGFGDLTDIQLHHFSDASEVGYGAASYLRLKDNAGRIHCSLVFAKSRVAPLKTITIPRMEVTAAYVSAKLHKFLEEQLDLPIHRSIFWTDSTIVLQYLKNEAKRFQIFVANRLAIIHDVSSSGQWHHVDSQLNPADLASRGFLSIDSEKLRFWLEGPDFLKEEDRHLRVRIIKLPTEKYTKGGLTVKEITRATKEVVKVIQREAFPKELVILQRITQEPTRRSSERKRLRERLNCIGYASPLRKLSPFLHDGVICAGGRLNNASIPFSAKHPMILPSKHPVTDLIIKGELKIKMKHFFPSPNL